MIGRRNSLVRPGVHVQFHREGHDGAEQTPPKAPPLGRTSGLRPILDADDAWKAYPAAAYLQLDNWAVNNETLTLDLAREEFAKPGTLYVWFFRGDRVVWEEQIRWPGYK